MIKNQTLNKKLMIKNTLNNNLFNERMNNPQVIIVKRLPLSISYY